MLALEPRYLYDGALITTGLEGLSDPIPAAESIPVSDTPAAEPSSPNEPRASDTPTLPPSQTERPEAAIASPGDTAGEIPGDALNDANAIPVASALPDGPTEIIIIDSGIDNSQELTRNLSPATEVYILDADQNGITQINDILNAHDNVDALHIFSHGSSGSVILGNTQLNSDTINDNATTLADWNDSFAADGDILLYGCNVGSGEKGGDFIKTLAELTGTDVAASGDATGSGQGENWDLEVHSGDITFDDLVSNEILAGSSISLTTAETSIEIDGSGNLIVTDINNETADTLALSTDGNTLFITDAHNILTSSISGASGAGTNQIIVSLTDFTGGIIVNTMGGDDLLTVDFSLGTFSRNITYYGGTNGTASGDALALTGGNFGDVSYTFDDLHSGSITLDGQHISYSELEPITANITATNVTLNYGNASETIDLTDAGGGQTNVQSSAGEILTFATPTSTLAINAGDGDDTINVNSLGASFAANLAIDGQLGDDTVIYGDSIDLGACKALTTTADTIRLYSDTLTTSGAQTYNGPVVLLGDTVLNASDVIFNGTVDSIGASSDLGTGAGGVLNLGAGNHTINTDTGAIDGVISLGFDGTLFNFTDITIASGATLTATGSKPLVMLALGDVLLAGTIDADGQDGGNGGADLPGGTGGAGGAGGYAGGAGGGLPPGTTTADGANGLGPGGGGGGINGGATDQAASGGGGGHATAGSNGLRSDSPSIAGAGGLAYSSLPTTLIGGSGGGGGSMEDDATAGTGDSVDDGGGGGGGGGGAIYFAGNHVVIDGSIDASGGKGGNANLYPGSAGGGGGSGGAIELYSFFAPVVSGTLDVAGGSGGLGTASSVNGGSGSAGRTYSHEGATPGGTFTLDINVSGTAMFNGAVGGSAALEALDVTADTITFNSGIGGAAHVELAAGTTATFAAGTTSTYIGTTTLTGGTTLVNGTLSNGGGQLTVQNSATLGGTGTISRSTVVDSGGAIAPGVHPGILNTANVSFLDNSTFTVEFGGNTPGNTDTDHDQLSITGTLALGNNVSLETSPWNGFSPFYGQSFTIINNDGTESVVGTFSGLAEGGLMNDFLGTGRVARISYQGGDGNDVAVTYLGENVYLDSSNNLVYQDLTSGHDNTVIIQSDTVSNRFIITDSNQTLSTNISGSSGNGTNTVYIPFAIVTGGNVVIDTLSGNDSLTVDYSLGNFSKALTYNGGTPTTGTGDSLTLVGGSFASAAYFFANASDGTIDITGNSILSYTGLEPITSSISTANVTLSYSNASETMTITDAGSGQTKVESTHAESVTFLNPTTSLTVNAGGGDDNINVANGVVINGSINGNDGNDTVTNNGWVYGDINGGAGNDVIANSQGAFAGSLHGGSGDDQISYFQSTVNSSAQVDVDGGDGWDTLTAYYRSDATIYGTSFAGYATYAGLTSPDNWVNFEELLLFVDSTTEKTIATISDTIEPASTPGNGPQSPQNLLTLPLSSALYLPKGPAHLTLNGYTGDTYVSEPGSLVAAALNSITSSMSANLDSGGTMPGKGSTTKTPATTSGAPVEEASEAEAPPTKSDEEKSASDSGANNDNSHLKEPTDSDQKLNDESRAKKLLPEEGETVNEDGLDKASPNAHSAPRRTEPMIFPGGFQAEVENVAGQFETERLSLLTAIQGMIEASNASSVV